MCSHTPEPSDWPVPASRSDAMAVRRCQAGTRRRSCSAAATSHGSPSISPAGRIRTWKKNWRWLFRVSELRSRSLGELPGMAALATIAVLSGCDRTIDGGAAWAGGAGQAATGSHQPTRGNRAPAPGIETTLPEHIAPNAFVCFPGPAGIGIGTVAQVSDPAAPRITLPVPEACDNDPGQGDVALSLSGPDGMTGKVPIPVTGRDPASAFADYEATLARS